MSQVPLESFSMVNLRNMLRTQPKLKGSAATRGFFLRQTPVPVFSYNIAV
jgi:hypothetical protein